MKKRLFLILHIAVWIAGTAFFVSGAFNNALWFDESYSVGIINHHLLDVCLITAADVHPPFYYILLKLFTLIFGKSLLSLRLFSVLFSSLLASIGFTHLRKDFGEKIGFLYTTILILFAVTFKYAIEIRMYSLSAYLVMMMCVYAYRYYKSAMTDKKSKTLFLIFSILGAYTHYYALAAAGAVNLLLLLYCKKNKMIAIWIKSAILQCISYTFGFFCLFKQFTKVVDNFWISIVYPDFLINSLSFYLFGGLPEDAIGLNAFSITIYSIIAFLFWGTCILIFKAYYKKSKEKCEPAILALKVYGIVVAFYFAVSIIRPLFHVRYLNVLIGLIVFFAAFSIDKLKNAYIKSFILLVLAVVLVLRVNVIYQIIYSPDNDKIDNFITENIKENDILVSDNILLLGVIAAKHPEIKIYFYDYYGSDIQASKAFTPQMETISDLSVVTAHEGRVWTLKNDWINEYIANNTEKELVKTYDAFRLPYHGLWYTFTLME